MFPYVDKKSWRKNLISRCCWIQDSFNACKSHARIYGGRGRKFRDPPPHPPNLPRLCGNHDTPLQHLTPLPPSCGKTHRIRTWVFSGIYNPSRMTLNCAHVISLNVITPYNALSRRFDEWRPGIFLCRRLVF